MSARQHFGLRGLPLPRSAAGKTFFADDEAFRRIERVFAWLTAEPGLVTLIGESGVGKTSVLRHLCAALPRPQYRVLYLCDTAVKPLVLYRMLAAELGLRPTGRAQIVADIKRALVTLVDERQIMPVLILDDAHLLPDAVLGELATLLNHDFDGRELIPVWLVGLPLLERRLRMLVHEPLAQRVVHFCRLGARTDHAVFTAMIAHAFAAAGAHASPLSHTARELLFRASRGVPRLASHLLRAALSIAHHRDLALIDDNTMLAAVDVLGLSPPTLIPPDTAPLKTRDERGTRSRK